MPGPAVQVTGLRELAREARLAGQRFPREIRAANKEAADVVAERTRRSMRSRSGVAPRAAESVRASAGVQSASVKLGGPRWPFAMGSNFGSHRYKQFPPPARPDYSLYTSIEAAGDEILERHAAALDRIARRAFPD